MENSREIIYALSNVSYAPNAPIVITAGELSQDAATEGRFVRLTLLNVSEKTISSAEVMLTYPHTTIPAFFEYEALSVQPGGQFGADVPIAVPVRTTESFEAQVTEAHFDDGTGWWYSASSDQSEPFLEKGSGVEDTPDISELPVDLQATVAAMVARSLNDERLYNSACAMAKSKKVETLTGAITAFSQIPAYLDSAQQIEVCKSKIAAIHAEQAKKRKTQEKNQETRVIFPTCDYILGAFELFCDLPLCFLPNRRLQRLHQHVRIGRI